MKLHERYAGITRAALEIALDNGGINRFRSERKMHNELDRFLARQEIDLRPIDGWLGSLSDEDLREVCSGCSDDESHQELLQRAPPFTDSLLDAYFEDVC